MKAGLARMATAKDLGRTTRMKLASEETYEADKREKSGAKPMPMVSRWLTMDAMMAVALARWLASGLVWRRTLSWRAILTSSLARAGVGGAGGHSHRLVRRRQTFRT